MSSVRVLVGTKKGAFILTSDGKRKQWQVSGPHFGGWEIYHMKGSPVNPDRLYASQTSGWFGQIMQRSDDGGKTWYQPGLKPGEPEIAIALSAAFHLIDQSSQPDECLFQFLVPVVPSPLRCLANVSVPAIRQFSGRVIHAPIVPLLQPVMRDGCLDKVTRYVSFVVAHISPAGG